jgi:serine/threonine protein kinase
MADLTGTMLGKYHILERRGRGGMATVYKAHHTRLDRDVAIKVLHSHLAEAQDFLGRFEREGKAVAALRHPHIIQAYDFDVEGDLYFLVMEYVDGQSVEERLKDLAQRGERMPLNEAAGILHQVAEALDYAHQQGMLHRDLKPSNVLLDRRGRAFLGDFGIARMLSGTQYTSTGELLGTPVYMSPEQGQGLNLTPASDLYSLGVVFYEMLTGQVPFDADTPYAIIHQHINAPLPQPRQLRPDIPPALEQVILKVLSKKPEDRYHSAIEMALAVEQVLAGGAPPAPPAAQTLRAAPTPPVDLYATGQVEQPLPPRVAPPPAVSPAPKPAPEKQAAPASAPQKAAPQVSAPPAASPVTRRRKSRIPAILSIIVLLAAVAAVLVFVWPGLPYWQGLFMAPGGPVGGGGDCQTIEECVRMFEDARARGDLEGTVVFATRAVNMVPPERNVEFAFLWCEKGNADRQLNRRDDAINDFTICIDWTRGEPGLQWLRDQADQQLRELGAR